MNAKLLLPFFFSLLFMVSVPCHAQSVPDEIWVAISFSEKGSDQPPTEYYGTIKKTLLTNILNTAVPTGFLKLRHVAWMTGDGKIIPLSEARIKETKRGYSRDMYFRIEAITRIVELDDQFVKENSFDLTDKK